MRRLLVAVILAVLAASPVSAQTTSPFNGVSIGAAPGGTGGGGSVTSVGLSAPSIFTVSGSPVTTSGTLGFSLNNQNPNIVFAGPSSGSPAAPTFRSLVKADLPSDVAYLDFNQSWTAAQRQPFVTVSPSGATFTPNFDTGQSFSMTLPHAACPCTLANPSTTPVSGQVGVIEWKQDATGGVAVTTWGSFYYAPGGTSTLTFTTTASHSDIWSYVVVNPTEIVLLPGATDVFH